MLWSIRLFNPKHVHTFAKIDSTNKKLNNLKRIDIKLYKINKLLELPAPTFKILASYVIFEIIYSLIF